MYGWVGEVESVREEDVSARAGVRESVIGDFVISPGA